MADEILNITITTPAPEPEPVTISLTSNPQPITVDVTLTSNPVAVTMQEARDAYQLAVAEGFIGTRAEWLASLKGEDGDPGDDGPPGTPAQIVVLSLAAYLALAPEVQMNGTWYVIPK